MYVCIYIYIYQWDRIENPEIDPHIYVQLIFNQSAKTTEAGNNRLPANATGKVGYPRAKE